MEENGQSFGYDDGAKEMEGKKKGRWKTMDKALEMKMEQWRWREKHGKALKSDKNEKSQIILSLN